MTRPPLELLADYIEASRERDAAEAAIRSGRTGCSDFVRAVTRELDAREALMQLDPAALRARVDIEADGMRAGLGGHAGTHNPYIWKGSPEHRDAWSRGQQAVEKFGRDRYQMGYEKAQEVAAVEAGVASRAQAEADRIAEDLAVAAADMERYENASSTASEGDAGLYWAAMQAKFFMNAVQELTRTRALWRKAHAALSQAAQ